MSRTDEFLNLYRSLEETLASQLHLEERRGGSVIVDFLNSKAGEPYREELNAARELRNLLSHHADIGGDAIAEPSAALLERMRHILKNVRRDYCAMDIATPRNRILFAYRDQNALAIMRQMQQKGFSHAPILEENRLIGVFSVQSVFDYLLTCGAASFSEKTRIGDLLECVSLDRHSQRFAFVARDLDYAKVHDLFERNTKQKDTRRLMAAFVTEHGRAEEALLGMITPWDVITYNKYY